MTKHDWATHTTSSIVVFLNGHGIPDTDALGEPITDDSFLLLFNPTAHTITFTLPDDAYGQMWQIITDTADPLLATATRKRSNKKPHTPLDVVAHSMLVLRCRY